jgi:hypothetical protein
MEKTEAEAKFEEHREHLLNEGLRLCDIGEHREETQTPISSDEVNCCNAGRGGC